MSNFSTDTPTPTQSLWYCCCATVMRTEKSQALRSAVHRKMGGPQVHSCSSSAWSKSAGAGNTGGRGGSGGCLQLLQLGCEGPILTIQQASVQVHRQKLTKLVLLGRNHLHVTKTQLSQLFRGFSMYAVARD